MGTQGVWRLSKRGERVGLGTKGAWGARGYGDLVVWETRGHGYRGIMETE